VLPHQSMPDDITEDEMAALARIPGAQDRDQWRAELGELLRRARARGDMRKANEIIVEWLKFRARYEDGPR
jgi:hypothetical protein